MPTTNYINAQAGAVSKLKSEANVRSGIYTGKPLNGYLKVPCTDIHQVDEAKRAQIAQIFRLAAATGLSLRTLLEEARRSGLTSSRGQTLSLNSLHLMLTNPFYCGLIRLNEELYPGRHEALVTPTIFEAVQRRLKGRRC